MITPILIIRHTEYSGGLSIPLPDAALYVDDDFHHGCIILDGKPITFSMSLDDDAVLETDIAEFPLFKMLILNAEMECEIHNKSVDHWQACTGSLRSEYCVPFSDATCELRIIATFSRSYFRQPYKLISQNESGPANPQDREDLKSGLMMYKYQNPCANPWYLRLNDLSKDLSWVELETDDGTRVGVQMRPPTQSALSFSVSHQTRGATTAKVIATGNVEGFEDEVRTEVGAFFEKLCTQFCDYNLDDPMTRPLYCIVLECPVTNVSSIEAKLSMADFSSFRGAAS